MTGLDSDDICGFTYKIRRFNQFMRATMKPSNNEARPKAKREIARLWGVVDVLMRNVNPLVKSVCKRPLKRSKNRKMAKGGMKDDDIEKLYNNVNHLNQIMCTEMMLTHGQADPKAKRDVTKLWREADGLMLNVNSLASGFFKKPLTRPKVIDMMFNHIDDDPF